MTPASETFGAIVQVDAVDLERLHHQVDDPYAFDLVQRDARLLACIAEMVISGQFGQVDAEIDLAAHQAPLAGLKFRRSAPCWGGEYSYRRAVVEKQLLVAQVRRTEAKHRPGIVLPGGRRHGGRTIEDRSVAADGKWFFRRAAMATADQADTLSIGPLGVRQDDSVAGLGLPQGLADRPQRSAPIGCVARLAARGPVIARYVVHEDIPPRRRHRTA